MAGGKKQMKGYESCSGCGVCLLVCPLWRRTGSMTDTRKARARALQGGASVEEIAASIDACLMCGSCEPACPEEISITAMNMEQRRRLNKARTKYPLWYPETEVKSGSINNRVLDQSARLLPGEQLGSDSEAINSVIRLLGGDKKTALASDDGRDITALIEAGLSLSDARLGSFLSSLRNADTLVVAEGLLHRPLREWLPGKKVMGLGESLLNIASIRKSLGPDDLYIIESRGYHSDFERLVKYYDRLRRDTGCQANLDLQRIAIPTGAASLHARHSTEAAGCGGHARWILKGRRIKRIVVEDLADQNVFQRVTDVPVVHISSL